MDRILETARKAATLAGECLLNMQGKAQVSRKDVSHNLVTEADIAAEKIITDLITLEFPDHKLLLEEGQSTGDSSAEHLWIVDPLDATNNFAHNIPHFSVSIAYAHKGQVMAGVVLDPTRNELFHAIHGAGAFLNDRPIRVTPAIRLEDCIIGTGFYYDRGAMMKQTLDAIHTLFSRNVQGVRRMGSAAIDIAWVACGRFDGFFEYHLEPWDYSAGMLLVTEAGGACSDRLGNPLAIHSRNVIISNGQIHSRLIDAVKWKDPVQA
ncbi:MAG: inositol monophosphatase family protein [Limisphaerales bacterium]